MGPYCFSCYYTDEELRPTNYYNMLDYRNICLTGQIVDKNSGLPVDGAVIRGWNDDWSVGMNTFSDSNGRFTLYSNDFNTHFEISAPGMSHLKFNRKNLKYKNIDGIDEKNLPDRSREYQQIDYRQYITFDSDSLDIYLFPFGPYGFSRYHLSADMGKIKLSKIR